MGAEPMRPGSRRRRALRAGMLAVLSTAFSCSYGDRDRDDEKKKDDQPKVEQGAPSRVVPAWRELQAAEIDVAGSIGRL